VNSMYFWSYIAQYVRVLQPGSVADSITLCVVGVGRVVLTGHCRSLGRLVDVSSVDCVELGEARASLGAKEPKEPRLVKV